MKIYIGKIKDEKSLFQKGINDYKIKYTEVIYNSNGKPYFKNSKVFFSKSHSYDYVCYCFSENPVGIDIEKIRDFNSEVLNYFFKKNEKELILKRNSKQMFFKLWTLKEAIIKMKGLAIKDIKEIEIDLSNLKTIQLEAEGFIITTVEKIK